MNGAGAPPPVRGGGMMRGRGGRGGERGGRGGAVRPLLGEVASPRGGMRGVPR